MLYPMIFPDNKAPIAKIISPEREILGETVKFDASGSYDPDGNIVDYIWDFDDGKKSNYKIIPHRYEKIGTYDVKLTVIDNEGKIGEARKSVHIYHDPSKPLEQKKDLEIRIP